MEREYDVFERQYSPVVIVTAVCGENNGVQLSFRCNFCHFATTSSEDIILHGNEHKFCCSKCSYKTHMQHMLINHQEEKHGMKSPYLYLNCTASQLDSTFLQNIDPKKLVRSKNDLTKGSKYAYRSVAISSSDKHLGYTNSCSDTRSEIQDSLLPRRRSSSDQQVQMNSNDCIETTETTLRTVPILPTVLSPIFHDHCYLEYNSSAKKSHTSRFHYLSETCTPKETLHAAASFVLAPLENASYVERIEQILPSVSEYYTTFSMAEMFLHPKLYEPQHKESMSVQSVLPNTNVAVKGL